LPGKVIGFGVVAELSDVDDWRKTKFDVVVANEVFFLFTAAQFTEFLAELRALNPSAEPVVGISRQGVLNNTYSSIWLASLMLTRDATGAK
jgi:hypothetical protein